MMQAAIERLAVDSGTRVIVLVSKPPAPAVAQKILNVARRSGKPVVVNFLGGDPSLPQQAGLLARATLEEAARDAVALARGKRPRGTITSTAPRAKARRFAKGQHLIHGLYSGGTLGQEAALILTGLGAKHAIVDLGDDEFTVGRPHPMIDFRLRNERIVAAAREPATAVILLDVVLGFGAHPDPAAALAPAIAEARKIASRGKRGHVIVASVCGTIADPQNLEQQEAALTAAGVLLAPSNAAASRLAAALVGAGPGARRKS
jgi:hypothetical protein